MINQGTKTATLNAGGSYVIPAGYHNGSGKVTANSLASQTSANAIAGDIVSGKTAWVNGVKVNGSMVNRGAWASSLGINGRITIPAGYHNGSGYVNQSIPTQGGFTLTPGTTQKTGAVSGKYMTGNITVPAINIPANIIKKNHRLVLPDGSSVTGTFEGWVPIATDLYYNGVNSAGFKNGYNMSFQNTRIKIGYGGTLDFSKDIDVRSYSKLNFQGMFYCYAIGDTGFTVRLLNTDVIYNHSMSPASTTSFALNITQLTTISDMHSISIDVPKDKENYITRIWLS